MNYNQKKQFTTGGIMAKKKIAPKEMPEEESKELFTVKASYVPGSSGFLWTLHKGNDIVVTGAQPYKSMELAIAAAHEFLKSI